MHREIVFDASDLERARRPDDRRDMTTTPVVHRITDKSSYLVPVYNDIADTKVFPAAIAVRAFVEHAALAVQYPPTTVLRERGQQARRDVAILVRIRKRVLYDSARV